MTDSLAVTTDGQTNFFTMLLTMTKDILPRKETFVYQPADETQKEIVFLPPCVNIAKSDTADRSLTITNCPPIDTYGLNHCAIERILNHIKDSYILGQYDDPKLEKYCENRDLICDFHFVFRFCVVYVFRHDNSNTLTVNFHISHTEDALSWGQFIQAGRKHPPKFVPSTLMSKNEVDLVADAFVRQCVRALRSYTTLVYNHAIAKHEVPNYYSTDFPE